MSEEFNKMETDVHLSVSSFVEALHKDCDTDVYLFANILKQAIDNIVDEYSNQKIK